MDLRERLTAIAEVEVAVAELVESGAWIPESVTYLDEEGEPFRVNLSLRYDPVEETDIL